MQQSNLVITGMSVISSD